MRRGEIWTVAGGQGYARKPRPVLIIQDDRYDATDSVTICPLTSTELSAPLFRVAIPTGDQSGLTASSYTMVDKITTVSRSKIGFFVGRASDEQLVAVDRAIVVFLGLAD
ncbi:MAG: type II toxin-antitoxin system PemK/MazF family toxin [Actinobacteria bacterium]|nr:type II toxin-antitoxin system PemK/MazF family toxin [Actinomycetota bacterium]